MKCAWCKKKETAGNSKYCAECRVAARQRKFEMFEQSRVEREERDRAFSDAWGDAIAAGAEAATEAELQLVRAHNVLTGENSEPFPICGFAWLTVRPGNCSFANWLRKNAGARTAYGGGAQVWIGGWGQSYDRKLACAQAMADELRKHDLGKNVHIYAEGRLD